MTNQAKKTPPTPAKQWLVRDPTGKTSGPFNRESMENLIARGVFFGDESISLQPKGEWVPIASHPEFYDLIIASLESGKSDEAEKNVEKMEAKTIIVTKPNYSKSRILGTVTGDETVQANTTQLTQLTQLHTLS